MAPFDANWMAVGSKLFKECLLIASNT